MVLSEEIQQESLIMNELVDINLKGTKFIHGELGPTIPELEIVISQLLEQPLTKDYKLHPILQLTSLLDASAFSQNGENRNPFSVWRAMWTISFRSSLPFAVGKRNT